MEEFHYIFTVEANNEAEAYAIAKKMCVKDLDIDELID